jgi:hypothetical protein
MASHLRRIELSIVIAVTICSLNIDNKLILHSALLLYTYVLISQIHSSSLSLYGSHKQVQANNLRSYKHMAANELWHDK